MGMLNFLKKKEAPMGEMETPPAPKLIEVPRVGPAPTPVKKPVTQMPEFPDIPKKVKKVEPRKAEQKSPAVPARELIRKPTSILSRPIFVRVDDYKNIIEGISTVKNSIKEADDIVKRMNDLRNDKEKQLNKWQKSLDDLQRKLTYIDKTLFGAS